VDVEVREKPSVSKLATQNFDVQKASLNKLNNLKVTEQYQDKNPKSVQPWETWMIMCTSVDLRKEWRRI
jgi:hypothetical protein